MDRRTAIAPFFLKKKIGLIFCDTTAGFGNTQALEENLNAGSCFEHS